MNPDEASVGIYCVIFVLLSSCFLIGVLFLVGIALNWIIPRPHRPKAGVYDKRDYGTPEWRLLRGFVIDRENGRCQYCGGRAQTAHHRSYKMGVICPPGLLRAICWPCHHKIHNNAIPETEWFEGELTDWEIEQLVEEGEKHLNR